MKGILLAGGRAKRLYPITRGVCKQLLPVYDKPMIYYPLSVLMLAGIRDILLISTPHDIGRFRDLFGDGGSLGIKISYAVQVQPRGIAESFIVGEDFIGKDKVCLVLGDNIFYGHDLTLHLKRAVRVKKGACVFGYYVRDPWRYGVLEFDAKNKPVRLVEKPQKPKTNWAVTGLYFYDNQVVSLAKKLRPSARGELEITDINSAYLKKGELTVERLGRGYAWLDTGTCDSLIDASIFIRTIEERQGQKVGCVEEIAYRMGLINAHGLKKIASQLPDTYREYLMSLVKR